MNTGYAWDEMLADFRSLGGIADNIEQRVGRFGKGIFPIDPALPVKLWIPRSLLLEADCLVLEEDNLVVAPEQLVDDVVRAFHNKYQRHFSWGAGGRTSVDAFESGLKTLPPDLLTKLRAMGLLNLSVRHNGAWKETLRRSFLYSRRITFDGRKVSMPIIELINHQPHSPGYKITSEGIGVSGTFDDEVTVNYSATSDSLIRFLVYGFACQEPRAYSLWTRVKLSQGNTLTVGVDGTGVVRRDGLPTPTLTTVQGDLQLSHLQLGMQRWPRMPRTLLRKALSEKSPVETDELFDLIRNMNQNKLIDLLDLLDEVNTPIGKMFRQALRFQLQALTYCHGVRVDL